MAKKLLFVTFLLFSISEAFAQHEVNLFSTAGRGVATTFVNDYHAIGINPANLGRKKYENKTVTFGLLEGGVSLYSGIINRTDLNRITGDDERFTYEQKLEAARNFTNSPFAFNLNMMPLGIAVQTENVGGFAFSMRDQVSLFSTFSEKFTELLFLGFGSQNFDRLVLHDGRSFPNTPENYEQYRNQVQYGIANTPTNFSEIFEGSRVSFHWYREYNLSYGKEVYYNDLVSISGGVGLKYLQGFGIMDVSAENGFRASAAFTPAINPYGEDFGGPSARSDGNILTPAGTGFGLDFGVNFIYKDRTKVGFAVTNIGSITYNANAYSINDFQLTDFASPGADGYAFIEELSEFEGMYDPINYEGKQKLTYKLPTVWRFGASQALEDDRAEIGFDIVVPGNNAPGNFDRAIYSLGGDVKPLKFLRLSSGLSYGGNFGKRLLVPIGVTLIAGENGTYEMGFASRDFISFFKDNNPALSFAFGFLRFRI